jgi:hypothetical protein
MQQHPDEPRSAIRGLRFEGGELLVRSLSCSGPLAFPLTHDYFELVWASTLGPTPVLLARALARRLQASDGDLRVALPDVAREIGVRASSDEPLGARSPIGRAVRRLDHHRIVVRLSDGSAGLRVAVPPVSDRVLQSLPRGVQAAHSRLVSGRATNRSLPPSEGE